MGNNQSTLPEAAVGEKLAERLEALEVKESKQEAERDYVYIEKDMEQPSSSPCSPTVSISTAEKWEKELMEDPKVFLSPPITFQRYHTEIVILEPARALCPVLKRS